VNELDTKTLSIASLLGASYVVIGYFIPFIAFGQYQCRIQDALYALIPLFGFAGVAGTFLGHFIYNLYGFSIGVALGPLDLLSPFIFLIPKVLLWKHGLKTLPIHILFVAVWVGLLLQLQFALPLSISVVSVGVGELIAEGLGVPLYYALRNKVEITNTRYIEGT
jgi:uncharacterized membrane protein